MNSGKLFEGSQELQRKITNATKTIKEKSTGVSIKFSTTTSRIQIEKTSTPVCSFLKPPHSSVVDGSYSAWVDALECQSKSFKIRGYDRPIPGIISGHFKMYEKKQKSPSKTWKPLFMEALERVLPERKYEKLPDSQIVEDLERQIEKRNASILGKLMPYMAEAFAAFSINASRCMTKKKRRNCFNDMPNCSCLDEEDPLPFVNPSENYAHYSDVYGYVL